MPKNHRIKQLSEESKCKALITHFRYTHLGSTRFLKTFLTQFAPVFGVNEATVVVFGATGP